MVGMVLISPVDAPAFKIFVDPSSITGLQPETPVTIRPDGDGYYKSWTKRTVVLRPNASGTYSGWTGRTLTLNPNGEGTHREWSGWTHLRPRAAETDETIWETGWIGDYRAWDDWPEVDSPDDTYVATFLNNYNETSLLTRVSDLPPERLGLTINKVRTNIVAKKTAGDDQVQMMLCSTLNANVSSFTADSGWNGWTTGRVGSSPWLNREDWPSNYVYTSVSNDKIGNFTFDDVPSGIEWTTPAGVYVRLRTWQSVAGNDTIKIHLYNGTTWKELIPFAPPATGTPLARLYRDIDVSDFLNSVTKINNAQMRLEKITDSSGVADTIYVDYACIRIGGARNPSSYGVPKSLTTSYATYSSDWSTNPITGLAWTWSDIDALQAGVRSVQVGASFEGYLWVTQLYVGIQTSQGIYKDWDDWPDPTGPNKGDEDYFTATANAQRQSSALPDHTSETWTISKVRVTIVARTNATTDEKVQPMLLPGPATAEANVDGFDGTYGSGWTKVGTTPWLGAADWSPTGGNYIYQSASTGPPSKMGDFSFANVPTGIPWGAVTLRIKTWTSGGVDGFDPMNIELYDGSTWSSTPPFTPTNTTAPGNYMDVDVSSFLTTVDKINAAKMRITKGKLGTEDTIYVDHAYLLVSVVTHSLTTTYTEYTSEWSTNPATGLAWTWSDIDALEVGVKSVQSGAAWTGEIRVTQLYVKVMEAANYANWDDSPDHNSDTDYNSAISSGLDQSSGLENQPAGVTWTPARVQVTVVAKTDIPTDEKIRLMLVIGTTVYLAGYSQSLSTSYLTYSQAWDTNPATLGPWDWTTINNLQAGVRSVLGTAPWTGEIRVTQLYVVVGEAGTYDDWNDTTQDGDATYVSATMDGMRETSTLSDVTDPGWTIARVRVVIVARNVTTNEKVSLMLRIGGVLYAYPETGYELTTDYQMYTADWGMNPRYYTASPYTGPWNWTAINALEAGVTSIMGADNFWTGEIRITQLYVEIAGPRFTVDIKAENVVSLNSFDFKLIYDTSAISATGIIVGSLFDGTTPYTEINDASGYARVASVSEVVNFSGNTTLATIIFLVDSTGATILDLSIIKLINLLGEEIHWILGDVDGDRTVDTSDLSALSNAYGSKPGDSNWNSKCDFYVDSKVDIYDLFDQSKNYGKTYAYDGYFSNI